ncbi:MAG TPA: sugar phosphate isomerase/epimerase family protein [Candidatus Acidoferrum sp.]|nr:sugar phosphate isomerase/epimerase family protein [Candidatus Acidoferrum sp.]
MKTAIAVNSSPNMQFPSAPRDRIAIASYPFRETIAGAHDKPYPTRIPKMDLKNFVIFVKSKFNINKVEPWSEHFRSLDTKYLNDLRSIVEKNDCAIVNIAVDGEHSPYAADKAEREKAVAFSKQWIDIAATVGSPSVRTNMPPAKDSKPDLDRAADTLLRVAEYGAAKNILVNLENDNPISEDPFFIVSIIEKVNSPWLHTNPDFANTLTTGKTEYAYKGIEAMFKHAYSICHVKAMEVDEKGQLVHVDMSKTFGILKNSNYKGYCSMEFDSPGDPYQGTSDLIEETLKSLT